MPRKLKPQRLVQCPVCGRRQRWRGDTFPYHRRHDPDRPFNNEPGHSSPIAKCLGTGLPIGPEHLR